MLGIIVGNLFASSFFYALQTADDVSPGLLFGEAVLASLIVAIPVKILIRFLFRITAARTGSVMDRVVQIFRVSAFSNDVVPSAANEAQRMDVALLHAFKRLYLAKLKMKRLRGEEQRRIDVAVGPVRALFARISRLLTGDPDLKDRTVSIKGNPVLQAEKESVKKTTGEFQVVALSGEVDAERMEALKLAEKELRGARAELKQATRDSQTAWSKQPKFLNARVEMARAQKTTLLKLAAVLADEPGPRAPPRRWTCHHSFIYIAWVLLFAYYIGTMVYVALWVFARDKQVRSAFAADGVTSPTDEEVSTATNTMLMIWLGSAALSIFLTFFVIEPFLITLRFSVFPALLSRYGRRVERRTQIGGPADVETGIVAAAAVGAAGAALATAGQAPPAVSFVERMTTAAFDTLAEIVNSIV